jgi:hypothetical protein
VCFMISSACSPVTSSLSRYKYTLSAWSISEFQAKTWQQKGRGQQKRKTSKTASNSVRRLSFWFHQHTDQTLKLPFNLSFLSWHPFPIYFGSNGVHCARRLVFHKQAWHSQPTVEQHIMNAPKTSDFCTFSVYICFMGFLRFKNSWCMKVCWWIPMLTFLCCAVVAAAEVLKVCRREEGSQGLNPFCAGYLLSPRTYVILWSSNKHVYLHMPQHEASDCLFSHSFDQVRNFFGVFSVSCMCIIGFFFWFSILWCSRIGNHSQEEETTRGKSQIWLHIREDSRHFLESCYALVTSKNPLSTKYGDFHVFSPHDVVNKRASKRDLATVQKKGVLHKCKILSKKTWLVHNSHCVKLVMILWMQDGYSSCCFPAGLLS